MKAFPHQFSSLDKLTAALDVLSNLIGQQMNPHDDGDYGSALAHAGVYKFRRLETTIEERLQLERQKSLGDQGFRTAARDIRRFFNIAKIINGDCTLTPRGREIIANSNQRLLRNTLWREAMLDLKLADAAGNVSHPYRVLLKLIEHHPGIETKKLFLAFEAENDSFEEFERVLNLSHLEFADALDATGTTLPSAANAVKILPSIAEQVGDIVREAHSYINSGTTVSEDGIEDVLTDDSFESEQVSATEVSPEDIAKIPAFSDNQEPAIFDLAAANAVRQKRTIKHHHAVASIAKLISEAGFKIFENPYDCLGFKNGTGSILVEVKTLDGTSRDERRQSIKALGQLKSYSYFNVSNEMKNPKAIETVAYDQTPDQTTVAFLKESKVSSIWMNEDQWFTVDAAGTTSALSVESMITS